MISHRMKSGLLLNPRQPANVAKAMMTAWQKFSLEYPDIFLPDSVGISTSGSTSGGIGSIVILSRSALEASAWAVNRRLQAGEADVWGLALPTFHVGGYSVLVRAALSKSNVVTFDREWSPTEFQLWLIEEGVTLLSLVPTQLFDLVEAGLSSPQSLRTVVVGGGRLDEGLHQKARDLGWPILQSYGMTECSSQIATATPFSEGRALEPLDHVELKIGADSKLWVKSPALLSARITFDSDLQAHLEWPVNAEGWFETSDRAALSPIFRILGRDDETVKVMGELVDLVRVRSVCLDRVEGVSEFATLRQKTWIVAAPNARKENELVLFIEGEGSKPERELAARLVENLRIDLAPFEVPSRILWIDQIPRSSLGKVLSSLLTVRAVVAR